MQVRVISPQTREVAVEFSWGDPRKGTCKCWAKLLTSVDKSKSNGFAFQGDWVRPGAVVTAPCAIVRTRGEGSWRHPESTLYLDLITITSDGEAQVEEFTYPYNTAAERREAILAVAEKFEQFARQHLNAEAIPNPLAAFRDEDLIAELRRRGYTVRKENKDE